MNGHTIDLAEAKQSLPRDASDTNYILIQCDDRVTVEENAKLNELQVIIHEYVGNGSYLCYYEPSSLERIEALPFVKHATVYPSEHKIATGLKETIDATGGSSVNQVKGAATAEGKLFLL
jgi:serine protease AprX